MVHYQLLTFISSAWLGALVSIRKIFEFNKCHNSDAKLNFMIFGRFPAKPEHRLAF